MTFDDVLNGYTVMTINIVYGGVALKHTGLTEDQRYLFIKWFNEYANKFPNAVPTDLRSGINTEEGLMAAYNGYAHLSVLRYPRIISLCKAYVNNELSFDTESWLINDLSLTHDNLYKKIGDEKLYLYNHVDMQSFKQFLHLERIRNRLNLSVMHSDYKMESLDVHAAMSGIGIKAEDVAHPVLYIQDDDKIERLLKASSLRAEALAELIVRL